MTAEAARTRRTPDEAAHSDHLQMVREMRRSWLWTNFAVISLGFWLVSTPVTFGFGNGPMLWNDVVSGLLLMAFASAALLPRFDFVGRWGASFVGGWLQLAPLVFWAPSGAAYLNDTLVGVLAIALTILVPMMPGMAHHMAMKKPGPEIPPGWTYNPSSWQQRAPLIALALLGWIISRYLAAFQLGYFAAVWDPFFGDSTSQVLTSNVSQMWPISDAGLGAFAYTVEMLMGWMGGRTRWRSMPWMISFFFVLIVPLGLTHIVLVILQPVVVGHWCTLCLAAAFVMLLMIPLMLDEVFAMAQFMSASVRQGKPFWRTFWVGDTIAGGAKDDRTPRYGSPSSRMIPAMFWGVTLPWTLVLSAVLGVWTIAAPAIVGSQGPAADSDHLVGALVTTVSVIATAEVVRAIRFSNIAAAAWIAVAPWIVEGATATATWNALAVAALLAALAVPRGSIRERYAGWQRWIW